GRTDANCRVQSCGRWLSSGVGVWIAGLFRLPAAAKRPAIFPRKSHIFAVSVCPCDIMLCHNVTSCDMGRGRYCVRGYLSTRRSAVCRRMWILSLLKLPVSFFLNLALPVHGHVFHPIRHG